LTIDGNASDHVSMNASLWLMLVAGLLLLAALLSTIRGTGSWPARRTWLLVAGIFLVVSMWLRLGHG
jgi:glucan phosphoethanolaminetransferase (alkaline phosphatase superfamily)